MPSATPDLLHSDDATSGTVADRYTIWCRDELFTDAMASAANIMEGACDLHLIKTYRSLNLAQNLSAAKTAAELTKELGFVESAHYTLDAMLYRLATRTNVVTVDESAEPFRYTHAASPEDPSDALTQARRDLEQLGPDYPAALEFLDYGTDHFVEALRDDPDLLDRMLSGRAPELAELWDRATNTDPLQDVHGAMGAKAIASLFRGGTILEIGGGTGNGVRHLFSTLSADGSLDRIERYIFTDISKQFVLTTRHAMRKDYPSVKTEWRFLDINDQFGQQKIEPESADLIYGVNAAHVAKDIVGFLKECHRALRPGGMVMFAERVRPRPREMAPREVTLNLSVYHRTAAIRNGDYRPVHCYLTPENWVRVLDLGGFAQQAIWPNMDVMANRLASPYAAVVIGVKD